MLQYTLTFKGAAPSSSESLNWMQTAMFRAWSGGDVTSVSAQSRAGHQQELSPASHTCWLCSNNIETPQMDNIWPPVTSHSRLTHLSEGLLVVIFELHGVDVQLVLISGEGIVVLGFLGEELLDLHGHPFTAVLKGLDGNVRGRHRVCGTENTSD